jgi:transcriptional adapter 1
LAGTKTEAIKEAKPKPVKPKKKAKVAKANFDHRYIPVDYHDYITCPAKNTTDPDFQPTLIKLTFCAGEGSLPDNFAAHLRMFVGVWESGLDGMADDAVKLMNLAIRDFMKNVLTSVLSFKSSYRTRENGRFKYAIGVPPMNPFIRNASALTQFPGESCASYTTESGEQTAEGTTSKDLAEQEAMFDVACSSTKRYGDSSEEPVTLWHLLHALKLDKSCIPSHTVYSLGMERIMTHIWHEDDGNQ